MSSAINAITSIAFLTTAILVAALEYKQPEDELYVVYAMGDVPGLNMTDSLVLEEQRKDMEGFATHIRSPAAPSPAHVGSPHLNLFPHLHHMRSTMRPSDLEGYEPINI